MSRIQREQAIARVYDACQDYIYKEGDPYKEMIYNNIIAKCTKEIAFGMLSIFTSDEKEAIWFALTNETDNSEIMKNL